MRYQRLIVAGGLVLLAALSWWFLAAGAGMPAHRDMPMAGMPPPPLAALVLMWWLMMIAMMIPSAAPAILLYGRVRQMRGVDGTVGHSWLFLVGYLLVWLAFSTLAAVAQITLADAAMRFASPRAQAAVLIAAGLYQLTPLKAACLRQCQSPAQFISRHWRAGSAGAVRLGLFHGAYCVGCCWLLMALLFVGGVMNFAWIAALTLLVGVEKLVPRGEWVARIAGVALTAWGLARFVGYA